MSKLLFLVCLVTLFLSFWFHELAHVQVDKYYGVESEAKFDLFNNDNGEPRFFYFRTEAIEGQPVRGENVLLAHSVIEAVSYPFLPLVGVILFLLAAVVSYLDRIYRRLEVSV